jgi:hypothetical protein
MNKSFVPFKLFQITTEEFATIEDNLDAKGNINLKNGLSFAVDTKSFAIKCTLKVTFEMNEKIFLIIQASCEFEIEPNAWEEMLNARKQLLTIDKGFATHLALLTTGTVRGILHSKTENTVFNQFVLPTLNVNEMVLENIKIDLK